MGPSWGQNRFFRRLMASCCDDVVLMSSSSRLLLVLRRLKSKVGANLSLSPETCVTPRFPGGGGGEGKPSPGRRQGPHYGRPSLRGPICPPFGRAGEGI